MIKVSTFAKRQGIIGKVTVSPYLSGASFHEIVKVKEDVSPDGVKYDIVRVTKVNDLADPAKDYIMKVGFIIIDGTGKGCWPTSGLVAEVYFWNGKYYSVGIDNLGLPWYGKKCLAFYEIDIANADDLDNVLDTSKEGSAVRAEIRARLRIFGIGR
jgi:hypothetical protein